MSVTTFLSSILDASYRFPTPDSLQVPFSEYYDTLIDWKAPVFISIGYYLVVTFWKSLITEQKTKSSALFTFFIVLHNLGLFLFSLVVFVASAPRVYKHFSTRSTFDALCDHKGDLWDSGIGYWTWIFYLSKFYEFVDTLILLLKNKKPSLLQSFHHAGIIICMWMVTRHKDPGSWLFVVFNSFVHTLMYFYYALTTIGIHPPGKKYLTLVQITQFVVGGSFGLKLFIPGCLKSDQLLAEVTCHLIVLAYLTSLTALFVDFAKRTYRTPIKRD